MSLLELKALSFLGYGPFNLSLISGEAFGVSGPSASGKTLLLKAIADLIESTGEVYLEGELRDLLSASDWRQKVMLVPAEPVWWYETVAEHFPKDGRPLDCEGMGLADDVLDWPVSRLSSGEKQRLGLARALARTPQVLLLDEPTANLDDKNTELVERCIHEFITETGGAVIWVSHDREQLNRVANRQAVMENKKFLGKEAEE